MKVDTIIVAGLEMDSDNGIAYINIRPDIPVHRVERTESVIGGIHLDFDREGRLLGIELTDADTQLKNLL
jgi:uncharacterized protein YuzE